MIYCKLNLKNLKRLFKIFFLKIKRSFLRFLLISSYDDFLAVRDEFIFINLKEIFTTWQHPSKHIYQSNAEKLRWSIIRNFWECYFFHFRVSGFTRTENDRYPAKIYGLFNPNEIRSKNSDKVCDLLSSSLNCHFSEFIKKSSPSKK